MLEQELAQFLADHPASFRVDPQISFRHIYFSPDKRADRARVDAERALSGIGGAETMAELTELGDSLPLPAELPLEPQPFIGNMFGTGFANALIDLPMGRWQGPVASGFGWHLVLISDRTDARDPALDEVRDAASDRGGFQRVPAAGPP